MKKDKQTDNDIKLIEDIELEAPDNLEKQQTYGVEPLLRRSTPTAEQLSKLKTEKEYPEDPFSYYESNRINVELSSGNLNYEVTDFIFPGKDGFDFSITRRYNSGRSNLYDMVTYNNTSNLNTGKRRNKHNIEIYGLGYGWSFNLPSIESDSYIYFYPKYDVVGDKLIRTVGSGMRCNYTIHLSDGRIINKDDHKLGELTFKEGSGYLSHPCNANLKKNYGARIEYKDGKKDYFSRKQVSIADGASDTMWVYKYVAQQDRFGNMIFYDLNDKGGMTVTDTWGRVFTLGWRGNQLIWTLPKSEQGPVYEIDNANNPEKLISATNLAGHQTGYEYYSKTDYAGEMKCANDDDYSEYGTGKQPREYMLLKNITYPNRAMTEFIYDKVNGIGTAIYNQAGGYISHFPLIVKKEVEIENGTILKEYNRTNYSYKLSSDSRYIEYTYVLKRSGDIWEKYKFLKEGQMEEKDIYHNIESDSTRTFHGFYTYNYKKLMTSAEEDKFGNDRKSLRTVTTWEYDNQDNVTHMEKKHPDDSSCNQDIIIKHGSNNIITLLETKIGTDIKQTHDIIREKTELCPKPNEHLVKCKRIYEVAAVTNIEVLKEKIEYEYEDHDNVNRVIREKRYYSDGGTSLEDSKNYVQTIYTYDTISESPSFTHKPVSIERAGIRDADGLVKRSLIEHYTYDSWGRLTSKTDARNHVTAYIYDKLGRVKEEQLPSVSGQVIANVTEYFDRENYIIKKDANGHRTKIQYTPFGQIERVCLLDANEQSPAEIVIKEWQYNIWGDLECVITYDGSGPAADNIKRTELYTYDYAGRVTSLSIPQIGYGETYLYNEVYTDTDNKKYYWEQKTIEGSSNAPKIITSICKDQNGQVRKEFLGGNRTASYEYDNAGNNLRRLDAADRVEQQEYDYAGRVVKSILFVDNKVQTTSFEYDALGNKTASWDQSEKKTEFQYDAAGRLIKTTAPFENHRQSVIIYDYDEAGNVIREKRGKDNGWQEVSHTYDALSRLTDTYQYLTQTDWIRTSYQYDNVNNLTQVRTGETPSGEEAQVTSYTYDRFSNVITTTDACGNKESGEYDKTGRLQAKTDRNGNRTTYQYDALDRLIKETVQSNTPDGLVKSEREYAYSNNGAKIMEISRETVDGGAAVTLQTSYYYDENGRLIRQLDPGQAEKGYTYDIHGNRQSFLLKRSGQPAADLSLYYRYDDINRLVQVRKHNAAGAILAEYKYDERGNRKAVRYPQTGIETNYQYNDGNRVKSMITTKQGVAISNWEYEYDRDGSLLLKRDRMSSSSSAITYCYDMLGRLIEEDYPGWKKTTYTYDAYSNRSKMTVEGRTKDELISVTTYTYDQNNRLEKERKKRGKETEIYRYYYDKNGNETFRLWERTRPTPEQPGVVKLTGNWKYDIPTVYEWRHYNGFNQLSKINQDEKEIQYQYRGDGLRHSCSVRTLADGQIKTTVLNWDGSDIVAEHADGEDTNIYHRGVNLIARETNDMLYYYIINEHGDVVQTWAQNGPRKAVYEYDAFGNEKNLKKEDKNPFRYCGEYYDSSGSTYYLRARNYRASTGRFLSEDSYWNPGNMVYEDNPIQWNGHISSPFGRNTNTYKPNLTVMMQSENKYVYGINNPIRYQDPSGYAALAIPVAVAAPAAAPAAPFIIGGVFVGGAIYGIYRLATDDSIVNENPQSSSVAMPSNASMAKTKVEGGSKAKDSPDMRPEGAITGGKKHGVNWTEGKARAKKDNKAQGQWAKEDLDFATEKAKTLAPRESAEFDLPEGSQSIVHMPDGTTQKATKMWIRNNGSGTWHGYPKP